MTRQEVCEYTLHEACTLGYLNINITDMDVKQGNIEENHEIIMAKFCFSQMTQREQRIHNLYNYDAGK